MSIYRVEEVDGGFGAIGLVVAMVIIVALVYLAVYVGIPALIIYVIYRIIKWRKNKKKKEEEQQQFLIIEEQKKRENLQNYSTQRLFELNELYQKGIITRGKYDELAAPLIKNLNLIEKM